VATSELQRAENQPWTFKAEAGWYVVADLADTVGALLVLDHQLAAFSHLPAEPRALLIERLLIVGDVARLARTWGTDCAADLATAGVSTEFAGGPAPIQLIRGPADLVRAQQHLTALVRPMRSDHDPRPIEERPGVRVARTLAVGQTRLALQCLRWVEDAGGDTALSNQLASRIERYRALHASTTRVVDTIPRRSSLAVLQQSEIVTQLRSIRRAPGLDLVAQINQASHDLSVALGKALRREGLYAGHIQALSSADDGLPVPILISNTRNAFHEACVALAHEPDPAPSPARNRRADRDHLTTVLERATSDRARRTPRAPGGAPAVRRA
jgi:hypothetical protein